MNDNTQQPADIWRATPSPTKTRLSLWHGDRYIAEPLTEDARRIVACVNALAGVSTGALERITTDAQRQAIAARVSWLTTLEG